MQLPGVDTGPKGGNKRMLVFFDPNCPNCAKQYAALRPYLDKVRIHWIPVGFLSRDSVRKAAAILAAPDPVSALQRNEEQYDFHEGTGGLTTPPSVPGWALVEVHANTKSTAFTKPIAVTPQLGMELYPGKRYTRHFGLINEKGMAIIVQELGDTMNPRKRTQKLLRARAAASSP